MSDPRVYLAGPMTGCTFDEANDWRETARREFAVRGIRAFSPMRAKTYLRECDRIQAGQYGVASPWATPQGIRGRDRNDVRTANAILMYLKGSTVASIGSCVEFGWADAYGVPMVMVVEPENIHAKHSIIAAIPIAIVSTLAEGIQAVTELINP